MPTCPICHTSLETTRHREGLYYLCHVCAGRALTVPHARRVAGDRFAARVLRLLQRAARRAGRECPFCGKPMTVAAITEPPVQFEGCLPCNAIWLDAPTFENLCGGIVESTSSLALQATEIYAEIKLKELKDRQKAEEEAAKKRKKRIRDL
jgi:Zn-finger nucleic acid-binding protein